MSSKPWEVHQELINTFQLGIANRRLGLLLPDKQLKSGKGARAKLQQIGVMRGTGHEHLNGSLVVPVTDVSGTVIDAYGLKLGNRLRKGTPLELNLNDDVKGLWNVAAIIATDELIVCENIIDAMTFWVHGVRNVVGLYLRDQLSPQELSQFKDAGVKRLIMSPGITNTVEELQEQGFTCFTLKLPVGSSVNQYSQSVSNSSEALGALIRHSDWVPSEASLEPELESGDDLEGVLLTLAGDIEAEEQEETEAAHVDTPPATRVPESLLDIPTTINGEEVHVELGERCYRVRGLFNNSSYDKMRINLMVKIAERYHVDQLDLYFSRQRATFINQACIEVGVHEEVIKQDLGRLLLKLETVLDEYHKEQEGQSEDSQPYVMTPKEECEALTFLKNPDLLSQLLLDYEKAGIVGEESNKLVGYIAAVSRLLDSPLAIMIQSTSAAGKSTLMESILSFIPEEEKTAFSAMTGQSLFYMGQNKIKHKILAIAEEEGVKQASYALKLLQSEGKLSIASTGKDKRGQLVTETYTVEGPVMLFLTTTAIDIDEELLNRCLVLTVNESREQTQAIHAIQRRTQTLEGLLWKNDRKRITQLHMNAQRLLRPLIVVNPFAEELEFISNKTRTRRDHMKYLNLIRAVCLLFQYQRDIKTTFHDGEEIEYINVTKEDIQVANKLSNDVLGRSLDELPPQTRNLLTLIHEYAVSICEEQGIAKSSFRFGKKTIRDYSGWGQTQLGIHLKRLVEMEFLMIHNGGRGKLFEYELLWGSCEVDTVSALCI